MDILSFKNRKRDSASKRVRRLLNRHCAGTLSADERRGDTRILYPQPACIIPLKNGKLPLIERRSTVFLCDLSATGISFFTLGAPVSEDLLLCLRDEADTQLDGKHTTVYIKVRIRQSSACEEGYTRTGCEILEEVQPTGRFSMLPLAQAAKGARALAGADPLEATEVPEVVRRMCSQPN